MVQHDVDADIHKNRLLQEIDTAITEANRVKIKAAAGAITQDKMLRVALAGSGLQANYLHEIVAMGEKGGKLDENPGAITKLKNLRIAY